jgi:ribosomal-protein-alanine N-acetyltransferase
VSLIQSAARIVRMQDADVATVATLEAEVSPAPWSSGIFSDCLRAEYECWVVRADKVFGFAILALAPGEAHLLNIAIAPDRQGQGFGRKLLRKAANTAKKEGAERIVLEVRPSNLRARAIYERAGFEFLSLREKYYGPPKKEDAFVYTLAL